MPSFQGIDSAALSSTYSASPMHSPNHSTAQGLCLSFAVTALQQAEEVLAGKKSAFTPQSSCVPAGVPFFMGYGGPDPIVFLQTPKEVWIVWREDNQARRVYMDVAHSANVKPSWYGESVGHY